MLTLIIIPMQLALPQSKQRKC